MPFRLAGEMGPRKSRPLPGLGKFGETSKARLDDAEYFLAADDHFGTFLALTGFNCQTFPGEEAGQG